MTAKNKIGLFELAIACYIYSNLEKFDVAYMNFLKKVNYDPDLTIEKHRTALLVWLNAWGCRQFARKHHKLASSEILLWYNTYNSKIADPNKKILDLTDSDLNDLIPAFDSLSNKLASYRVIEDHEIPVKIGSTGAAKILFAIRRNSLIPWDLPIRTYFKCDESGDSYANFVRQVIIVLKKLEIECNNHDFTLDQLPVKIGKPESTLPKLIDEYYWVMITNKGSMPDIEVFKHWIEWSSV